MTHWIASGLVVLTLVAALAFGACYSDRAAWCWGSATVALLVSAVVAIFL